MTDNIMLINIVDEFLNCLEVSVTTDLYIDTKIDLLKKRFQSAENKYAENTGISYVIANMSLKLWNETLNCNLDPAFTVNVQELIYLALRSLIRPQFMTSNWLVIKTNIALSTGKKFLAFKGNCSYKEKAIQCFDYIEEIFYSQDSVDCITVECKISTLLSHIEALEDDPEKAKIINEELQNLIKEQPKPIIPAAITFYNIGLKYYNNKWFSESIYWLHQSLDYGCNSDFHGQISSLLAETYLTWNGQLHWKQAEIILDAVDKKFPIDPLLRLKTSLANPNCSTDHLSSILNRCFQEKCSIEQGIKILECLIRRNYKELALEVINNWIRKHDNLSNDGLNVQKVFYYELRLLLDDNRIEEMKRLTVEYLAIEAIGTKTSLSVMDIVEQVAVNFLNNDNFLQAVEWFTHCIDIGNRLNLQNNEAVNKRITKYYHQKCSCLLKEKEWNKANSVLAILTSSGDDYNCTVTQYLQLQIYIGIDDQDNTIDALKKLCEEYSVLKDGYDVFKMIMMCIQLGISMSRFSIVVIMIEFLNNRIDSSCTAIKLMQLLFKCKLATKDNFSSIENQKWLNKFGENVYDQFTNLKKVESSIDDAKIEWFFQMFWNIAHSNKENRALMNILMQCSDSLLSLCHCASPAIIQQRKMCLLLAITSGIEINRCCKNLENLKKIANLIEEYKMLSETSNSDSEKSPAMANKQILLFELETKIELQSSDIEEIYDKCSSISDADAKYYELLAAISYKKNTRWSIDCIRVAIDKLQLQAPKDYKRICQLFHSLVVFQINRINSGDGEIGDLTIIIDEIKNLLEEKPSAKNEFPQDEIAWLVARCWNSGVQRLVYLNDPTEAHNCCMAAMKLGLYLGVDYQRYLDKMNLAFPIMLKKNWSSY